MNITAFIKLQIKLLIIHLRDFFTGTSFGFASKERENETFGHSLDLSLEIKPGRSLDNKVYNLKRAAEEINSYVIKPGEIFSFWEIIKDPNLGYKKSRSIIKGRVIEENGGGLCQVSGIIYYIAIIAGLEVLERHNHSMDIYTDRTRFTPLGTDATVVYGSKDLRIRNNSEGPVRFVLQVDGDRLTVRLLSVLKIEENSLVFKQKEGDLIKEVEVYDGEERLINLSRYKVEQ